MYQSREGRPPGHTRDTPWGTVGVAAPAWRRSGSPKQQSEAHVAQAFLLETQDSSSEKQLAGGPRKEAMGSWKQSWLSRGMLGLGTCLWGSGCRKVKGTRWALFISPKQRAYNLSQPLPNQRPRGPTVQEPTQLCPTQSHCAARQASHNHRNPPGHTRPGLCCGLG